MKRLLRKLDETGDSRVEFDLESGENLAAARAAFDEAVKKGSSVFNVTPGSSDLAQRARSFEELGQEAVIVPKITAG